MKSVLLCLNYLLVLTNKTIMKLHGQNYLIIYLFKM